MPVVFFFHVPVEGSPACLGSRSPGPASATDLQGTLQHLHAGIDLFQGRIGKIESKRIFMASIDEEMSAGYEGNLAGNRLL